jgi:hypothetical protein
MCGTRNSSNAESNWVTPKTRRPGAQSNIHPPNSVPTDPPAALRKKISPIAASELPVCLASAGNAGPTTAISIPRQMNKRKYPLERRMPWLIVSSPEENGGRAPPIFGGRIETPNWGGLSS